MGEWTDDFVFETCARCGSTQEVVDMLYDDNTDEYLCDSGCFEAWASDNFYTVMGYYKERNIQGE